jgi:hypothetical protein
VPAPSEDSEKAAEYLPARRKRQPGTIPGKTQTQFDPGCDKKTNLNNHLGNLSDLDSKLRISSTTSSQPPSEHHAGKPGLNTFAANDLAQTAFLQLDRPSSGFETTTTDPPLREVPGTDRSQ